MIELNKSQDENAKIWRYMDFTKFASLLSTGTLFLSRADKFEDPFEGSMPKLNRVGHERIYQLVMLRLVSVQDKITDLADIDDMILLASRKPSDPNDYEYIDVIGQRFNMLGDKYGIPELQAYGKKFPEIAHSFRSVAESYRDLRQMMCINCWHISDIESDAMWRLYARNNEGVAIQSTYSALKKSLIAADRHLYIGGVKYIDFETEMIEETDTFAHFFYKRKAFIHEKELRVMRFYSDFGKPSTFGVAEPVDLHTMIHRIHVSPAAPDWFFDLVKSVTSVYKIGVNPTRSEMGGIPVY